MSAPAPAARVSIAGTAHRFALAALLSIALLPPLLSLGGTILVEHGRMSAWAASMAWVIEREPVAASGPLKPPPVPSALNLPADGPVQDMQAMWRGVIDAQNRVVHEVGQRPAWPAIARQQALRQPTRGLAAVRLERSLWPLIGEAMWVGLLSAGLALALWARVFHRSVRALERVEAHWRSAASLDTLTGLLNREGLRRRLERALHRRLEGDRGVGVLLIDLDRFDLINDTLGHAAGDQLLRETANRIRSVTRHGDGLARLGADQFAVQVEGVTGTAALAAMAHNLARAFELPYALGGRDVVATSSIGIAMADAPGITADGLLQHALVALRTAKRESGNRFRLYQPSMGDEAGSRLELEQRLRAALGAGQFFVVYQAIVDARTLAVVTVEALLRWQDPQRGVVSPVEFIPVLEQTGLIVPVGRWVMQEACRQLSEWSRARAAGGCLKVSVNVSPRQFAEADFAEVVNRVVREAGIAPGQLQLEVTEGLLLDPTPQTLRKLAALAAAGVKLAVDDFGMGYSSLAYLKRFRLHALKIDRMFVRDIAQQAQDLAIVRAIVDLGHGLGLHVTAEGVETEGQCLALRQLGCDSLQGYLFSRPERPERLELDVARAVGPLPSGARPAQGASVADPPLALFARQTTPGP